MTLAALVVGVVAFLSSITAIRPGSPWRGARCLGLGIYAFVVAFAASVPVQGQVPGQCVAPQLIPFHIVLDASHGPLNPLLNVATLEAVANIVFFLPVGLAVYLARLPWRQSAAVGFGLSLVIELSQFTGMFGVFRCAYRTFDVDDLLMNTLGAMVGWWGARLVVWIAHARVGLLHLDGVDLIQRLAGMATDAVGTGVLGASAVVTWRAFDLYVLGHPLAEHMEPMDLLWLWGFPALVEAGWLWLRRRTLGEGLVHLHPVVGIRRPAIGWAIKFFTGVGGYLVVGALPIGVWPMIAYGLISIAGVFLTPNHRGLSHSLAGMELRVAAQNPGNGH